MAATNHKAYSQSIVTILAAGLNSLANNANSASSAAIDNSSYRDLFMDLELYVNTQGSARSAGATVGVYMSFALDGTNYTDENQTTGELIAVFTLDAATTARRMSRRDIPIPPSATFKLWLRNQTGQTLASSSNTLKYRTHSLETT